MPFSLVKSRARMLEEPPSDHVSRRMTQNDTARAVRQPLTSREAVVANQNLSTSALDRCSHEPSEARESDIPLPFRAVSG